MKVNRKVFNAMLTTLGIVFLGLVFTAVLDSCARRTHYQVVEKRTTAHVYHNQDGVYYTNNGGVWMVWMLNSSISPSSTTFHSVTYASADRFTSAPDFSRGSFVPVSDPTGGRSVASPDTSAKSFDVRGDQAVGSGGFGRFDTTRDAKTEQEQEVPEETLETDMGVEVPEANAENAIEGENSLGESSGTSSESSSDSGSSDSGGDSGGGGDGGGGGD